MKITVQMTAEEYDQYRDYQLSVERQIAACEHELDQLRTEHRSQCHEIITLMSMPTAALTENSLKRMRERAEDWLNNDDLPF